MIYQYNVTNIRVVDGDTVDCDIDLGFDVVLKQQRVRLSGIDAPESRTSDATEKVFGLAAKHRLEQYLDSACIRLTSHEFNRGKFGRILGDFQVDSEVYSACQTLLNEFYAVPYFGQAKDLIDDAHLQNRAILIETNKVQLPD